MAISSMSIAKVGILQSKGGLDAAGIYLYDLPPNSPEHRAHGKGDSWRI